MVRWWDHWLKDADTGLAAEPPVTVFDLPSGGWRYESAWPPVAASTREYFLCPGGTLSHQAPTVAEAGADSYAVNPTVGLNHLPWDWTTPTPLTAPDISPDDHRALTYTSAPLASDLHIAGNPELAVRLSADQPDFPLVVWLSDVSPTGFSTLICQGWIRASHAAGGLWQQSETYDLRVPLNPTSYVLEAGHRLRVALAGACFPMLISPSISPTMTVHRGPDAASLLRLPVHAGRDAAYPMPSFGPRVDEEPEAYLRTEGDYDVCRDLTERSASYRMQHRAECRLEADTILRTEQTAEASLDAQNPRKVNLNGNQVSTVERARGGPIEVHVEAHETFDFLRISADIHVDGRVYFRRSWELDLYRAEWAYRRIQ
jgi:hypothetical protein